MSEERKPANDLSGLWRLYEHRSDPTVVYRARRLTNGWWELARRGEDVAITIDDETFRGIYRRRS